MDITWRAFPLHPETAKEGLALTELFGASQQEVDAMVAGLKRQAQRLDLPFGHRTMTFNSRLAQELGLWAASSGRGDAFHMAAFKAYFVHGRNIAQMETLRDIAKQAGLSPAEAEVVVRERRFKKAVDDDWTASRRLNITAAPTFICGNRRLVGAQSFTRLKNLITGFTPEVIP